MAREDDYLSPMPIGCLEFLKALPGVRNPALTIKDCSWDSLWPCFDQHFDYLELALCQMLLLAENQGSPALFALLIENRVMVENDGWPIVGARGGTLAGLLGNALVGVRLGFSLHGDRRIRFGLLGGLVCSVAVFLCRRRIPSLRLGGRSGRDGRSWGQALPPPRLKKCPQPLGFWEASNDEPIGCVLIEEI